MTDQRLVPTISLMLGDRNGIGPEVIARFLSRDSGKIAGARLLIAGERAVMAFGEDVAGTRLEFRSVDSLEQVAGDSRTDLPFFLERRTCDAAEPIGSGRPSAGAGREILDQLRFLLHGARAGLVNGIVFAPFNKQAMKDAGLKGDTLDYVIEHLVPAGTNGELSVLDNLWTSRVTSHVPLKDVAAMLTERRIVEAIRLMNSTLKAAGRRRPKIAVAGLNPHAGDGGTIGDEEIRVIAPAVNLAAEEQIDVSGPYPADSVFIAAKDGKFDAVVAMYHDQSQLALKLLGFGKGVTLLGGLPIPITTAMHGTGYDIVGKGIARAEGFAKAFGLCHAIATRKR